jgi:hypothetical protein
MSGRDHAPALGLSMADDKRDTTEHPNGDSLDMAKPVIARFEGGPLDTREHVFFRARTIHWHRVSRGPLRRVLRTAPRYALYEVGAVWWEEGVQRGVYRFIGYDPDDLPGARPPVLSDHAH